MPPDVASNLALLTPRERECLALVSAGLRSKEIGPILGIEPGTVDITIKRAARRVGCSDRKALARLLHQHEPDSIQSLIQRLVQPQNQLVAGLPSLPDRGADDVAGTGATPLRAGPVLIAARHENDLSAWQKRLVAGLIALSILVIGALLVAAARYALLEAAIR